MITGRLLFGWFGLWLELELGQVWDLWKCNLGCRFVRYWAEGLGLGLGLAIAQILLVRLLACVHWVSFILGRPLCMYRPNLNLPRKFIGLTMSLDPTQQMKQSAQTQDTRHSHRFRVGIDNSWGTLEWSVSGSSNMNWTWIQLGIKVPTKFL